MATGVTFLCALLSAFAPWDPWLMESEIDVFRYQTDVIDYVAPANNTPTPKPVEKRENITCPASKGRFPYPGDCLKYILCVGNKPSVMSCPGTLKYDRYLGCTVPTIARCETAEHTFVCPERSGRYQYFEDCHKYYECENGESTLKACLGHLEFDAEFGCVLRSSTCV